MWSSSFKLALKALRDLVCSVQLES